MLVPEPDWRLAEPTAGVGADPGIGIFEGYEYADVPDVVDALRAAANASRSFAVRAVDKAAPPVGSRRYVPDPASDDPV